MANILKLFANTMSILPKSALNADSRLVKLEEVDVEDEGEKKKRYIYHYQSNSAVPGKSYFGAIAFDSPESSWRDGGKPRYTRESCRLFCTCDAFYYYFAMYNYENKCLLGAKPEPYARKTDSRPEKNPGHLPGMCKHQIAFMELLTRDKLIRK